MIKIQNKSSDIKNSNLVCLIETISDLKILEKLTLDKKIIDKITSVIKKEKNTRLDFFLGNTSFENLHILFFSKKDKKKLTEFLGEVCPKLPDEITLLANNDVNFVTLIYTCILSRYSFDQYKSEKNKKKTIIFCDKTQNKFLEAQGELIKNICFARDLGETPACDLTPDNFAKQVKNTKWKNTKIKIFSSKDIEKKGLGLLHAVGKGSINKPKMVILERIVDKKAPTYGLVGKGIVFDSGGLDIKPTDYMYEMKGDMCGAGTTFALMKDLDKKDLKVNIIACLVLAENSVSGESYRPSDIITSYSGKTVNITNTDAEGRLVLADGIAYISKNYKLEHMMTIATLTGAVMVACGHRYAGIMGTDRKTIDTFLKNSKTGREKYCELPFDDYYIEKCKSEIADLDNWTKGVMTGSTMGAAFLYHFLQNNEKYTHFDIAGTAINSYEPYEHVNKGMTGFGVESLSHFFLSL